MSLLRMAAWCVLILFSAGLTEAAKAETPKPAVAPRPDKAKATKTRSSTAGRTRTVEELTEDVRDSVVVISFSGRDGRQKGLGTGFVVSADGLIATNLHVLGEGRPIAVRTTDDKRYDVTRIEATERTTDLALIRIDAVNLPALPLGDSDALRDGQQVVAMGNPLGYDHSVVSGVVSGRREIDGRPMIQLAIPIEQGNSGGPLFDMHGRVQGILAMKSVVSDNLGFAVPINALKPLLAHPNPVPMNRWLTIGALDPREWTPLFGAHWRQRAGRILVKGRGSGFGGRSLCLSAADPPDKPFEVAVFVKLDDERGAAGLVFQSDGGDNHYGFYPSNGSLRLSRFDGPDVFRWKVLQEVHSAHYHPGEWNHLKVRVEEDRIQCFVNDKLVIESADATYRTGKVGLAKFRDTVAEFKGFQVANSIPPVTPPTETVERITGLVAALASNHPPRPELVDRLLPEANDGITVLRQRAKLLEQRAERLRQLAEAVHQKQVREKLVSLFEAPAADVDLLHAALLIAQLDNDELNVDAYRHEMDRMAEEIRQKFNKNADEATRLNALNTYLFKELGFHGSRTDYYNRSNSYLNEVIDDREGLPITLSVLYMELARRIGLKVVGIGLPGHFVVRFEPTDGEGTMIDVYDVGKTLTRQQAAEKVKSITGQPLSESYLAPLSKKAIVVRMLHNLLNTARDANEPERMLRYVEALVALDPESPQNRFMRAVLRYQTDRIQEALVDADWLMDKQPPEIDLRGVRELRQVLQDAQKQRE